VIFIGKTYCDPLLKGDYIIAPYVQYTITNSVNNHVIKFANSLKQNFMEY
jgi:hypothetical protein